MPNIFSDRTNQIYIGLSLIISVFSWLAFKYFYPNPNIIFDSYYYIYAALVNDNVSAWPIGYSKFIQLVGLITHSANALLLVQYVFLQLSFLFFFLSMRYLFSIRKWPGIALFAFLFLNPIYLYTCNLVLSDTIFLGLSLIWLINLFWIIFRPRPWMILTQALLLFLTFTIRHSALIYPLIACLAFVLSRQQLWQKLTGIAMSCAVVGGFMLYTMQLNKQSYGVNQFSPFQGWKIASNALYGYEHVPSGELKPVPEKFQPLDSLVHRYFRSRHIMVNILNPDPSWGSYYMFMYPSPLLLYKDKLYGPDFHFLINIRTLSGMGPLYDAYGSYIIKKYPLVYARYFVLPNVWLYMMPYPEVYYDNHNPFNLQRDTLGKMAQQWFGDLTLSAPARSINFRTALFAKYPLFNMGTHLFFLITLFGFFSIKGHRKLSYPYIKAIWLLSTLWLLNFFFIVIASASLLRYQLFIIVVEFAFAIYFLDFIQQSESEKSKSTAT